MPPRLPTPVLSQATGCLRCRSTSAVPKLRGRFADTFTRLSSSPAIKSATTPGFFPPPVEQEGSFYAHLSNRSIIRLHGLDVVDFLNGLLPARLHPLQNSASRPIFTAFLSAKGRVLYEAVIYPPAESNSDQCWYVDVDATSASGLFSHLKKHKLRSKFKLEKVAADEVGVYYAWPDSSHNVQLGSSGTIGGQDPRPLMGTRFLSGSSNPSPILLALQEQGSALTIEDYTIHRIINGHAEGPQELVMNSALPQESNLDFEGGIDFHKGCYLGQELTIRTHHTGVVRKRILPCQIFSRDQSLPPDQQVPIYDASVEVAQPPVEANISKVHAKGRAGRSTGKWLGGAGNVGLALCRLEVMTDVQLTAEGTAFDSEGEFAVVWEDGVADADGKTTLREVRVKPFVPQWLRQSIEAGIRARSERGKRRKQEDDEDDDVVD